MLLTLGRGLSPASSARASLADLLWTIEGDSTAVEAGPAPQYTVNYSSYALQPDETASVTLALADVDTQPADFLSTLSSRLATAAAAATGITWTQIDAWSGILTFSDGGDTSLTFDLPLVEELGEDAEDFTLAISAPSHGALGASNSVTTTISADPTGVMDDYLTNAEGIYGFEPLTVFPWGTVDGVANPLTRIRRASDNAEKTFNAGDIGTVTTWLAGAAGYVTKKYSQYGQRAALCDLRRRERLLLVRQRANPERELDHLLAPAEPRRCGKCSELWRYDRTFRQRRQRSLLPKRIFALGAASRDQRRAKAGQRLVRHSRLPHGE